ncbi:YjiH family protein [Corynebacterium sp. YIM 101645]|uniref:YjiH family protein n=1 Tax=Corynebacterium lemuris TaxID=1859292 RepID=A0ABT2FYC4_9CORY|nr:YjiH family protein [Corynebacterium lemuris]MCS5478939.1 YjiH family protein [Corynebacterium lemuris]
MTTPADTRIEGTHEATAKPRGIWRLFVYSAIGIVVFFFPMTYQGKSSIPLDHMVTMVREYLGPLVPWFILALVIYGTARGIINRNWRNGPMAAVFTVANVFGLIVALMIVFDALPAFLAEPDLAPFLWNSIAVPVGLIVPIGSVFLALLVSYGLLEFVGVFMQPIMRPIWKTPGRSAIDAVASFVGSYSIGLLITDRVYQAGRYTAREAAIVATGFSTVSAAFMVIVANSLGLMEHWLTYFFVSLFVTFLVTAITVRIPPLSIIPDDYFPGATPEPEKKVTGNRFRAAWDESLAVLRAAPSLKDAVLLNLRDGIRMASAITPSIMSIGLGGLLLAKFTPIFDWLGYLFYPFAWIVRLPEPLLAGKAAAVGIAEMFLPAGIVADQESMVLRFVIGVVCISAIIFFSAMVPCIMATRIPLKVSHMVILWFERVALTILITTPIAHLLF